MHLHRQSKAILEPKKLVILAVMMYFPRYTIYPKEKTHSNQTSGKMPLINRFLFLCDPIADKKRKAHGKTYCY